MARSLNTCHWVEEPLNGEVPYQSVDVIVEDSDIDECPSTKAERNRRREAIGRRYLLGYLPFIQTAYFRGPFNSKSGWVSPWKRTRSRQKAPWSPTRSRGEPSTRGELKIRSKAVGARNTSEPLLERELNDQHVIDDTVRYDADNEDETFEQTYDGQQLLEYEEDDEVDHGKHAFPSHDKPHFLGGDNHISDVSEGDFEQSMRRDSTRTSMNVRQVPLRNGKKRKVDVTWLRGVNVRKRSRYEVIEHSSPTPAAGNIHKHRRRGSRPHLQNSDLETSEGLGYFRLSQKSHIDRSGVETKAKSSTSALPSFFDDCREIPSKVTKETAHGLHKQELETINTVSSLDVALSSSASSDQSAMDLPITQNLKGESHIRRRKRKQDKASKGIVGQKTNSPEYKPQNELRESNERVSISSISGSVVEKNVAPGCGELCRISLGQGDVHNENFRVSRVVVEALSPQMVTHTLGMRQLDVAQLSPSDVDSEDLRSLDPLPRSSHRGARSATLPAKDRVSENPVNSILGALGDKTNVLPPFDGTIAFCDVASPDSEESFHYHKANRNSQGWKSSPHSGKRELKKCDGKERSTTEQESPILPKRDPSMHSSRTSLSSSDVESLEDRENPPNWRLERDRNRQSQSTPLESSPDHLDELDGTSSPDPLCDDLDRQQQIVSSDIYQSAAQTLAGALQQDSVAMDGQRTIVTQASLTSRQQSSGTQSPSRGLLKQSISQAPKDQLEPPTTPIPPIQCQPSEACAKRSVSTVQAENTNKTPVEQEFDFIRTQAQLESLRMDKTPTESPYDIQQSGFFATKPIKLEPNSKVFKPPNLPRQGNLPSETTPVFINAQTLEEPTISQSPWAAVRTESLERVPSSDFRSSISDANEDKSVILHLLKNLHTDKKGSETMTFEPEEKSVNGDTNGNDEESARLLYSSTNYSPQLSREIVKPASCFPSTQTLVDAATANPWSSAFKKPRLHKLNKRVSFGPLPPSDINDSASDPSSRPQERMESPPPPAGALRLTHLDDPFHHRLKATKNLEVTEESLTKFMNTCWDDMPAIKPCAKPPSNSPAVTAMAEAFVTADQHSSYKKAEDKEKPEATRLIYANKESTEKLIQPEIYVAPDQHDLGRFSWPDSSFSIAPCGKVTAVSIEGSGHDAEDNLRAVLDDMGSFLEAWDVETELRKAKGHIFEKGSDIQGQRKREYLSGVLNK